MGCESARNAVSQCLLPRSVHCDNRDFAWIHRVECVCIFFSSQNLLKSEYRIFSSQNIKSEYRIFSRKILWRVLRGPFGSNLFKTIRGSVSVIDKIRDKILGVCAAVVAQEGQVAVP